MENLNIFLLEHNIDIKRIQLISEISKHTREKKCIHCKNKKKYGIDNIRGKN